MGGGGDISCIVRVYASCEKVRAHEELVASGLPQLLAVPSVWWVLGVGVGGRGHFLHC